MTQSILELLYYESCFEQIVYKYARWSLSVKLYRSSCFKLSWNTFMLRLIKAELRLRKHLYSTLNTIYISLNTLNGNKSVLIADKHEINQINNTVKWQNWVWSNSIEPLQNQCLNWWEQEIFLLLVCTETSGHTCWHLNWLPYNFWKYNARVYILRRNSIENWAISGFSGQKFGTRIILRFLLSFLHFRKDKYIDNCQK